MKPLQRSCGSSTASFTALSRSVNALGQRNRKGKPGFDLLYVVRDPAEGRRFLVRMTPKGMALQRQLVGP